MPTTKCKNIIYRMMLPFFSPNCGHKPVDSVSGHCLVYAHQAEKLYRKHHVLGSATLLSADNNVSVILTSSSDPPHHANIDTFFRVASITKLATSVLTMHLADKQLIDPDAPVSAYFSSEKLPAVFSQISLRHLLSHTSGLSDPPDLENALNTGISFPELIHLHSVIYPQNTFHYSNLGFGIIGCILESVFNMPVGRIYDQYLFAPLKMNATLEGCRLDKSRIMPVTRLFPYHPGSDLILTPLGERPLDIPDPLRHYGHTAGSMYADVFSILTLLKVLSERSSTFLSITAVNDIKKQYASYGKLSPTLSYGLGLLRITDPYLSEHMIFGHQGFAYGCADGAFWEDTTGKILITLNGGCSEARTGRLGTANRDFLHYAFQKELPAW